MAAKLAQYLRDTVTREFPILSAVDEATASRPAPAPGFWNAKQELGHLIDSAANNHQRFVRAVLDGSYQGPGYAQDDWVRLHAYEQLPFATLAALWQQYNLFLAHLIDQIPKSALEATCQIGNYPTQTLGFVIDDYVLHMQHHLDHLLAREVVTKYPR